MTKKDIDPSEASARVPFPAPLTALVAFVAALAFLYVTRTFHHNEAVAEVKTCPLTEAVIGRLKPLIHGEIAALALADPPRPMPPLNFTGPDGKSVKLSDFRGRNILLNLWATWCIPCRREMPALDRLEAKAGGPDFHVVAINIDTARPERPKAFLKEIGVKNLIFYTDSKADVFQTLKQDGKVVGLPTTILVGKDGCAIGSMAGPAQWDSDDALALIKAENAPNR
ncbi:TlpA disulfide reductase family protein [Methylovirgula sp. HY1]|uniref:thiol:disulfide interchange protein TlpA n=1 Tax=Methylovirgula sp. HY1 TaxID=2822761 RepID=UPI001C5AE4D8|nr:TlpA disulfide reductase family protein [Methylovirgula sp. HY1]QXX75272.1 Thiol:disulfide interchange protein TlpA [Methylovirgula sp. HY1]